jgi:hypothetical protein
MYGLEVPTMYKSLCSKTLPSKYNYIKFRWDTKGSPTKMSEDKRSALEKEIKKLGHRHFCQVIRLTGVSWLMSSTI